MCCISFHSVPLLELLTILLFFLNLCPNLWKINSKFWSTPLNSSLAAHWINSLDQFYSCTDSISGVSQCTSLETGL